ncbi:omptin family outer membrane protease, partial [Escherichia coli]|nr:omptin family outer membrane protease [Escherichia coli]
MMSLWDALRMNMMISYQELVRTFPNAKVYVEGAWNRVTNKKGNTSLYDHNDNTSDYSKNGAGIENYNFITTAGLKYTF